MELASVGGHGMLSTLAIYSNCAEYMTIPQNVVVLKQGDDGETPKFKKQ
jgi:hypothetical protein